MQEKVTKILFALLRSAMKGQEITAEERNLYGEEILSPLFSLAKKHDMAHLAAVALEKNSLLDKNNSLAQAFLQEQMKAVYRYEQLNYELNELCETLENAKIPFIPLKGSVIRKYYPEPWMRTSCDIDILVKEADVENAANYLVANCGYSRGDKGSHDISLFSSGGNHLELHYDLVEEDKVNGCMQTLQNVWNYVFPRENCKFGSEMIEEFFYFYHVAHMAKHFEEGGCGIRPFIDLWILDNLDGVELKKRNELLQQGNLLKFAEVAGQLSKVWFEGAEHTEITKQMEQYILRGGVYGTMENRVAVQQQKKGGRLKYALSKIFLPYDVIKFHYPVLQKHRWLMPFMQVRRWFKLIFCGHAKRSIRELKQNKNISLEEAERVQTFLENIGL